MNAKLILKSTFIFFLCIATSNLAISQPITDVSGEWHGMIGTPFGDMQITYMLQQKGAHIDGYSVSRSLNGKDSTKIILKGLANGAKVHLRAIRFEYKTGTACLAQNDLMYLKTGEQELLKGRWKGDLKLSTCPPGVSGKINVMREQQTILSSPAQLVTSYEPAIQTVHQDDFEGNALVNELNERNYYALVIGIDEYNDQRIESLDNPVSDAKALSDILNRYYTFEKEHVKLLTNPTRSQIIESFDELSYKINEKDQLLIFYAGHGIWDERLNQGFWLPADANLDTKAQWLSNSTIRDYIGGIQSKHTLLITDACFSGSIFKERAVFTESKAMLEMYKLPSRKAMTSGALKTVPDKSVFIEYLNKNLANNDRPLLSAEELFRGFKTAVINNSANGQVPQYGPIGQVGDEGGDFIFLKRE